jgi:hypothetical protein
VDVERVRATGKTLGWPGSPTDHDAQGHRPARYDRPLGQLPEMQADRRPRTWFVAPYRYDNGEATCAVFARRTLTMEAVKIHGGTMTALPGGLPGSAALPDHFEAAARYQMRSFVPRAASPAGVGPSAIRQPGTPAGPRFASGPMPLDRIPCASQPATAEPPGGISLA